MFRIILLFLLLIFSFVLFCKYKQEQFLGLSEPQIQTKEDIINYARNNGIIGDILVAKDSASYEVLKKYFDFGYIYVFDKHGQLLDCNIESAGGRCFQDIQEDICDQVKINKRDNLDINSYKIWDKLINNSECITGDSKLDTLEFSKFDYIILFYILG